MEEWKVVAVLIAFLWLVVGLIVAGDGFDRIRDVEINKKPKVLRYRLTLLAIYPIILLRASFRGVFGLF